jgi:hypothetical protein
MRGTLDEIAKAAGGGKLTLGTRCALDRFVRHGGDHREPQRCLCGAEFRPRWRPRLVAIALTIAWAFSNLHREMVVTH